VEERYRALIKQNKNIRKDINRNGGLCQAILHDAQVFVDSAYKATGEEIYIVSFCGEDKNSYINSNGLLSQWRGYGTGGGIALVFNTQKLEEILKKEGERYSYDEGHFADVSYSDDEEKFETEILPDVASITAFAEGCFNNMILGKQEAPDDSKVFRAFIKSISLYKHCGFKEENEVRIVCLPTVQDEENLKPAKKEGSTLKPEKERKFRTKNGKLIPYIELFDSTDIVLPIEKIIVGPHKEKNTRASALRVMLRSTKIEITVSDIPYVD
jgi:hypothetical protein